MFLLFCDREHRSNLYYVFPGRIILLSARSSFLILFNLCCILSHSSSVVAVAKSCVRCVIVSWKILAAFGKFGSSVISVFIRKRCTVTCRLYQMCSQRCNSISACADFSTYISCRMRTSTGYRFTSWYQKSRVQKSVKPWIQHQKDERILHFYNFSEKIYFSRKILTKRLQFVKVTISLKICFLNYVSGVISNLIGVSI